MKTIESLINPTNAALATRFICNLDQNAIEEKYQKLGLETVINWEAATKNYCNPNGTQLVEQVVNLSKVLKDEAKQQLANFLVTTALMK